MVTLQLEVINPNGFEIGFYNPAPDQFRAFPRTENGVKNALHNLKKLALSLEWAEDFRVACYDGKKESWNDKPFIGYIDRKTLTENF